MKYKLYGDERYPVYSAYTLEDSAYLPQDAYSLEMSDDDWFKWLRVEEAYDAWQNKFSDIDKAESKRRTLENSKKNGIQSKGF